MKTPAQRSPATAEALPEIFLAPGTYYCTPQPTSITTVLGSCIAVCLWDQGLRVGGMNHYVLPRSPSLQEGARYGDIAMAELKQGMIDLGCRVQHLRAKIFGGAAVLSLGGPEDTVGEQNARLAVELLRRDRIPLVARSTGGRSGMLIRMNTGTGEVLVRRFNGLDVA